MRSYYARTDSPVHSNAWKIGRNNTGRNVNYSVVLQLHLADFGHVAEILEKILLQSSIGVPAKYRHSLIEKRHFLGFTGESRRGLELVHIDKEEMINVSNVRMTNQLSSGNIL